jgi:hypothetical protein
MQAENGDDPIRSVWQSQHPESSFTTNDIRRRVEQMEKRMRRSRVDLYIALMLTAVVIVGLAVFYANALLLAGAAAALCGMAVLVYEVEDHRRRAPAADDGSATSLQYHRALLQHRLTFCRRRLWLRMLSVAPGGVLFFVGFAMALPDLAPFIYFQLFTFAVVIMLMVPLNRRSAR